MSEEKYGLETMPLLDLRLLPTKKRCLFRGFPHSWGDYHWLVTSCNQTQQFENAGLVTKHHSWLAGDSLHLWVSICKYTGDIQATMINNG